MRKTLRLLFALALVAAPGLFAQDRPASPPGKAATQVGGEWKEQDGRQRYVGGKWIEISYGRPILRQREDIFGSGETYGQKVAAGAPVWRLGANQSTRLVTEVALKLGDTVVPAGEYSLFADLTGGTWTLIVSNWPAQQTYDRDNKEALWGAYGYTPDKDVARVKMEVDTLQHRLDQLTIGFSDVTRDGGAILVAWDRTVARVPFTVAE